MKKATSVYNWLKGARSLLYPAHCLLCGNDAEGMDLCTACLEELPYNRCCCPRCGLALDGVGLLCGACQTHPPPFDRSVIPLRYEAPVDHMIRQLKFQQRLQLAPLLGEVMAGAVRARAQPLPALLLPVPMSGRRLRERGYNQALELARSVSRQLAIGLDWQCGRRSRHTAPQLGLSRRERLTNLRGAFVVEGRVPSHVAIIDDVVTTGATVAEYARALRRAGAQEIEVWAVARAGWL